MTMKVQTIWKFILEKKDCQRVGMPEFAEILDAQMQNGQICLWALLDPERPIVERIFSIYGTGHSAPGARARKHIATVQEKEFSLVWHIFED